MEAEQDLEQAHFNMVEQQVRPWEVLDHRVLELLHRVKREEFVPARYRELSYIDLAIPIGHGEAMLPPTIEGRMLQSLALAPTDRVLEVGTGTGYMTALLASLGGRVCSVDIVPEFTQAAAARLESHRVGNLTLETGDAARGWERHGPYDAIVLTGSVPILPESFRRSLAPGGRLVAVVGEPPVMEARLITCVAAGAYDSVGLFETCIAPLKNAQQPQRFVF